MDAVQPQEIFQAIGAVLQPDPVIRQQAEQYVNDAYRRPGCATALLAVAAESQVDVGLRQLAAVLLKHLIHRHWNAADAAFEEPEVSEQEKVAVRPRLLELLFQVPSNVSTPLAVCVTAVANWDFPEEWPELLSTLLAAITADNTDDAQVSRRAVALQALSVMAEEMDDDHLPAVSRALLPVAVQGITTGALQPTVMRQSLSILTACVKRATKMSTHARKDLKQQLKSSKDLVPALCSIMSRDLTTKEPMSFAVLTEALKLLQELLCNLGKFLSPQLASIMAAIWHLFEAAPAVFEALILPQKHGNDAEADDAGDELATGGAEHVTIETVVEQLYELLLTVLASGSLKVQVKSAMQVLVYNTITFMQMTVEQEEAWSSDANCYVVDEDVDAFGARSSCEMLLSELRDKHAEEMGQAVNSVVTHRMQEAMQAKAAGDPRWWRLREAALAALSTQVSSPPFPAALDTQAVLSSILEHDLRPQDTPPFLRGRALFAAAKLAGGSITDTEAAKQAQGDTAEAAYLFLQPAIEYLRSSPDMVVRVCACRAVSQLLPRVPRERAEPLLGSAHAALVDMMGTADQDVLQLVLVTLHDLVRIRPEVAHNYAATICSATLHAFPNLTNDATLMDALGALLATLAAAPGCLPLMAQTGLPPLVATLQNAVRREVSAGHSILLEGTLDLLCSFVSETDPEVAQQIYSSCAQPACELLLHSGEDNIIQSSCALFRKLLLVGGERLLTWAPGGPSQALHMLSVVFTFVLSPKNSDTAAMFAPGLALQALLSLPTAARDLAPQLVKLLVVKAVCCDIEALRGALLGIIARIFVDQDPEAQLALLASCEIPPPGSNPVATFFSCWTANATDTRGAYPQRLCALALSKMLASKHPSLAQIQVPGRPQYQEGVGVRTRRQKALHGSGVYHAPTPLPARLMHAAVQLLRAADEPPDADDQDWRNILYGPLSDDESDEGSSAPGGLDGDDLGIESLGRAVDVDPLAVLALADAAGDDDATDMWRGDPLLGADVGGAAISTLLGIMHSDRQYFDSAIGELNGEEQKFLHDAFEAHSKREQSQHA